MASLIATAIVRTSRNLNHAARQYMQHGPLRLYHEQIICSIFPIFSEKAVFSKETAKNCFEGTFDHFF